MTLLLAAGMVAALLPVLEGVDGSAREGAIDSIAAGCAPREMAAGLSTAGWRGRAALIDALTRRGPEAFETVCRVVREADRPDVRRRSILALGKMGGKVAGDSLVAFLEQGGDADVILEALGKSAAIEHCAKIRPYLGSDQVNVRRQAVVALGLLDPGDPDSIAARLNDVHHSVRHSAAEALGAMGPWAGESIRRRWESLSSAGRIAGLLALGKIGDGPSVALLTAVLGSRDPALASSAAAALGVAGASMALEALETAATEGEHPLLRLRARAALELLNSESDASR